jgi:hypothetical protein
MLHAFAEALGLRRAWFQNKAGFPHYDLIPTRRAKAVVLGAVETNLSDWLKARRNDNQGTTPQKDVCKT